MSTQKPAEPQWGVTFPEGEQKRVSLYSRDSLTRACQGNERMASVLDYFLYEGSWEMERQKLPKGCKVVELTRKHEDVLKRLTFNLSRKSLIGYLDTFDEWKFIGSEKYHNLYKVDFDAIQAAIDNPPAPKERKPRTRKGCKVEAITTEDNASTLAKKVEVLQLKVEELQHYVEELQPLGCKYSTLQRDFVALVERLEGQSSEDHSLYNYPNLSFTDKEGGAFAPGDFLPGEEDELPEEDEAPTVHKMPAIKLNGHTPEAMASIPGSTAFPPAVEARPLQDSSPAQAEQPETAVSPSAGQTGGATTRGETSEPRPPGKQEKPKRGSRTQDKGATQPPLKTQEELAFDARCSRLYQRFIELRGYEWSFKGEIINEHKYIRLLAAEYSDERIEQFYSHLCNDDFKYSKPSFKYKIGAYIVYSERKSIEQQLKKQPKYSKPAEPQPGQVDNPYTSIEAIMRLKQQQLEGV